LPPGAQVVAFPIASSDMFKKLIPMFLKGDFSQVPPNLLDKINRMLVRKFTEQYAGLLRALSDPGNRPLVFHCTQGKDRAGFGAAMVLSALGVPWETVVEDYLLSNHFRKEENDKMLGMIRAFAGNHGGPDGEEIALSRVEGLMYVKEQSLQAAHAEIIEHHGNVDAFLTNGLGCSAEGLERLRDELLE
jgi:protein-tyrosine phosphatase